MMRMMRMVLLFLFHFSDSFPLKGWVCEDNAINTINAINTTPQGIHKDKHTSSDVPTLSVVTPIVGVSIFLTLLLLSFMLWKRHDVQAGGVLGSLIHYPAGSLENRTQQEPFYLQKPPEIPC